MTEFAFDDVSPQAPRFGRSAKLTILDGSVQVKTIFGYDDSIADPFGLRMSFQVQKKIATQGDTARIKIWNLNPESRAALAQRSIYVKRQDPLHYLKFEAGYIGNNNDNVGVLFNGTMVTAVNKRMGADWVTELEGSAVFGQALLNVLDKSWSMTPTTDIINELFAAAGWPQVIYTPAAAAILAGKTEDVFVASGSAYQSLQLIMLGYRLTFNVDTDGAVVFSPGRPREAPFLRINEVTGLVGTPQTTFLGANFRSLLDPRIRPGQLVRVDSNTLRESITDLGSLGRDFMAWEVTHSGDTHTDDWFSDVIAWFSPQQIQLSTGLFQGSDF